MAEVITNSGAVMIKAGANRPTLTAAQYTEMVERGQAMVCALGRYNFTSAWGSISGMAAAQILSDAASSYAAMEVINYDMSGYTSRTEAQTMLDVNWSKFVECANIIKDEKYRSFVIDGTVA